MMGLTADHDREDEIERLRETVEFKDAEIAELKALLKEAQAWLIRIKARAEEESA